MSESKMRTNQSVYGLLTFEDTDYAFNLPDILDEASHYEKAIEFQGFEILETVTNVPIMNVEGNIGWLIKYPYLEENLFFAIADNSKDEDIIIRFMLQTKENALTENQETWLLIHLMDAVLTPFVKQKYNLIEHLLRDDVCLRSKWWERMP